jgi:hypothetical protein
MNWRIVRLVLILSLLAYLKSRQIDYVNAFMQASADCDIFISIPAGFSVLNITLEFTGSSSRQDSSDFVLRIKKSMYSLRQAGNNWFDALQPTLQICYTIADTSLTFLEYGYPTTLPRKIHGQHSKTH